MARLRRRTTEEDEDAAAHEINVTPLIDVMLVLLIVFMIAAPLATTDLPIDLPALSIPAHTTPKPPITISLTRTREIVVSDRTVEPELLGAVLDKESGGDRERRLMLRADRAVDYGSVVDVMNRLRRAGYLRLGLVGLEEE